MAFFNKKDTAFRKCIPKKPSIEALSSAFLSACKKDSLGLKECAVLFSGGIDSSLVAFSLKGIVPRVFLYCSGVAGSPAIKRARENAELLGMELREVEIKKNEIPVLLKKAKKAIGSDSLLQLQIALPAFVAMQAIKKDGIRTVFSGTGADELFCGYKEFCSVLEKGGHESVEALIWEKLEGMRERNLEREFALSRYFGLRLAIPFLEKGFVLQAMAFPASEKILCCEDALRKHPLRELARYMGLPEKICLEKKKAIQFDSGTAKEIEKIFKADRVLKKKPF
ncbi:MAG: asparagine synthase-related protein [Candidatus Diapherotrites archaeon]